MSPDVRHRRLDAGLYTVVAGDVVLTVAQTSFRSDAPCMLSDRPHMMLVTIAEGDATMTLTEADQTLPNLYDGNNFVEGVPHAAFATLREMDGLYWQATDEDPELPGFWVATRREDILAIENDPETFTSTKGIVPHMMGAEGLAMSGDAGTVMFLDPPEHSRLRRVVAKSLAPRVVANFETWIRDVVTEILDDIVAEREIDFVSQAAALIPSRTIAKVVGFPDDLRDSIVSWTNELFAIAMSGDYQRYFEIAEGIKSLADELRVEKLENPAEDLISYLAPFERDGVISNFEYRNLVRTFINAGFETTHTTISQIIRLLAEKPAIAKRFAESMEEGGADLIVEEFLRLVSPVMLFMRVATRDAEVAGTKIKEGDVVSQWYGAANRDPGLFENPDEFVPGRANGSDHLAFGAGVHRCIGAPLAKLQIRILLEEMHRRGIKLELNGEPRRADPDAPTPRGPSSFINQLTYLPVKVVAGS